MFVKSIVSLGLSFVILFSSIGPAKAATVSNAAYFTTCSLWDQMLLGLCTAGADWPFGDVVQDIAASACNEVCSASDDGLHHTSRFGLLGRPTGFHPDFGRYGVAVCDHCGKQFNLYSQDLSERGDGFVDGLDGTEASSGVAVTGFSASTASFTSKSPFVNGVRRVGVSAGENMVALIKSLGVNDRVAIVGIGQASPYYFFGVYFDESGVYRGGKFKNPFAFAHAMYFGVYSLDDLELIESAPICFQSASEYLAFYSESYAKRYDGFVTSNCLAFNFERVYDDWDGTQAMFYFTRKISTNVDFSSGAVKYDMLSVDGDTTAYHIQAFYPGGITWDNSRIVVQPINTDESSRLSALTAALNEWNQQNTLESGSTVVNYYISPVDSDGTYFHPGLYDEETLVYSDPVTETQYLTNGWTYDYLTRSYTLDMADDTYLIGDTVIDTIKLTYGDELLTVDHYSGGSLIRSDEYNYVMASGSECGLNGHSYTYENVKAPTCTAPGERKYTCTVCGDSYAEEIPQIDHVYANYTVTQDATCTAHGIVSYTCSACGGQYTELLDKLGHDWQPTASTEEAYVMPDNVNCPDCYGTVFSHVRYDSEIIAGGKNLCDLSILQPGFSSIHLYLSAVGAGCLEFVAPAGLSTNGFYNSGIPLKDFAPGLTAGETYTLSFLSEGGYDRIYLEGVKIFWSSGASLVITNAMLDSFVVFYGPRTDGTQTEAVTSQISGFQIELGPDATEYEPYDPERIEIVPPIYTFTCSGEDCGAVWMQEAEYQGASVTFSCTRCGAEKIEVEEIPIDEEGWFDFMGDLLRSFFKSIFTTFAAGLSKLFSAIADFFSWIFGFLSETVLSGIKNFFNAFGDDSSIFDGFRQENEDGSSSVALPSGVATVFQFVSGTILLLPDDLRLVLIFGVAALFLIAVFKSRP